MKKSGEKRLKYAIYESTLSTAARSPFPNGEGKEVAASPQKRKPTPPRCAPRPFQGKGLAWTLPLSYGRRGLEGADKDKMFCRSL